MTLQERGIIMNDRIKELRKTLNLTQNGFADRLGVKRNTVAQWEIGVNNLSEQVTRAICREFNVNEIWLRTGEGEMFVPAPSGALDMLAQEYDLSVGAQILIKRFLELKPENQQAVVDFAVKFVDGFEAAVPAPMSATSVPALDVPGTEMDIAAELAEVKRQNQEMARQNKELLTRLEILEKEEDEYEREQMEQSIFPTRPHCR